LSEPDRLDALYAQAREALAGGEQEHAALLLKQILTANESYRDASRLLAALVARRRRRWYTDRRLWGAAAAIAALAGFLVLRDRLPEQARAPAENSSEAPDRPPTAASNPSTPAPAQSLTLPTSIPLAWRRLYHGGMFTRDQVTVIVVDPNDSDVVYVGTQNAGVYKSIDGGRSWKPAHRGLGRASIHSLAIDPQNPNLLYAGTLPAGLYRTTDGGQIWQVVDGGFDLNVKWIASLVVIDPQESGHLLYSPAFSVYESTDGGAAWVPIAKSRCPEVIAALVMDPQDAKRLFAIEVGGVCSNGLYQSSDGGKTWSLVVEMESPYTPSLAIDAQGDWIYASMSETLFASSDGGETWSQMAQTGCNALAVDPAEGQVAFCSEGSQLLQTRDGGTSWTVLGDPQRGWIRAITIERRASSTILVGANGLVISMDKGLTWEDRSSGIGANRLELKLPAVESAPLYIEQDDCQIFRSLDGGLDWQALSDQFRGCQLEFDSDGETLYLTGKSPPSESIAVVLRSTNQGQTWESLSAPYPGEARVDAHSGKPGVIFLPYNSDPRNAYISRDHGTTWDLVLGISSFYGARIFSDGQQGDIVYSISEGFLAPGRSEDGGETWQWCLGGEADLTFQVARSATRAVVDPGDGDQLWVATQGQGVLASRDGCRSWQPENEGLGSLFVNSLAVDPNSDTIYAGTDDGAYVSFDGGLHWGAINEGLLGANVVYSIAVDLVSEVYAATPYGVFRLEAR